MVKDLKYILLILLISINFIGYSQETASLKVKDTIIKPYTFNPLSPAKAAFYSAILPGLGQAYNKKYWKIPLVYGGIGAGLYYYNINSNKFNSYRDAYKRRLAGYRDDNYQYLDDSRLITAQQFYQRNRDLSLFVAVAFYALNIVDANIDAHLMQFNVNDKLSFRPEIYSDEITYQQNLGLTLNFHF